MSVTFTSGMIHQFVDVLNPLIQNQTISTSQGQAILRIFLSVMNLPNGSAEFDQRIQASQNELRISDSLFAYIGTGVEEILGTAHPNMQRETPSTSESSPEAMEEENELGPHQPKKGKKQSEADSNVFM